jgi:hypothetical protein
MTELTEDFVRDFVKNKTVLVLGSAQCVSKLKSDFMNTFDIIVRCNNYKHFNACHRVDIYYSFLGGSVKKNINDIVEDGAKFIFCRCPNMDFSAHVGGKYIPGKSFDARPVYEMRKNWFKIPYFIQTFKNYRRNYALVGRLLTTGVSAIIDIKRYDPKRLFVAGFDFFTNLIHNVNEICNLNTGHDFPGEYKLIDTLWKQDKIEISSEMIKLYMKGKPEWDLRRLLKGS